MPREPIPSWFYALVVVRKADKFLLVREVGRGNLWYLPAGRIEPGEAFEHAAVRETLEEAGVPVRLLGLLRFEHSPGEFGTRVRVVYLAEPADDTPPKSVPDEESLEARWVSLAELGEYPLRGEEVKQLFEYVAGGAAVFPLELVRPEGSPYLPPG